MAKYKIGDKVIIKTKESLEETLEYRRGLGFVDPDSSVVFIPSMYKTCGDEKIIKKIHKLNNIDLYYFGPDPRMDFAYVEAFFEESKESPKREPSLIEKEYGREIL